MRKYSVFAIGNNSAGKFGLGHCNNLKEWTRLSDLEDILSSIQNIYVSVSDIMIISNKNELYVAGFHKRGLFSNIYTKNKFVLFSKSFSLINQ